MLIYVDKDGLAVHAIEQHPDGSDVNGCCYLLVVDGAEVSIDFRRGENILGLTNEAMLSILTHRLTVLDQKQPCPENKKAISAIQEALSQLQTREQRLRPNVEFSS